MKLIEEVLSIGQSKISKNSDENNGSKVHSQVKRFETTKTEEIEVIPESIHVTESLAQQQNYAFQIDKEEEPENLS